MTTLEEKNAAAVDAAIAQKARLAELRRKAAESKQAQGDSTTSTTTTTTTTTTQPVITGPSESERLAQRQAQARQRREEQQMNDITRGAMEYYDSSDTKYYRVGTDTIYRKDYLPLYDVVTGSGAHAQWWLTDAVLD